MSVSIEKKSGVGNLQCKVCGQTFQTNVNCEWDSVIEGGEEDLKTDSE